MNKKLNIFLIALIGVFGLAMTGCDDDKASPAQAVLASASGMSFEALPSAGQMITVYSDATWTCEHPDWITVEPETGSGTTEVRISVTDNLRDGTINNPRKADIVFKGVTKASESRVTVRQSGDRYRDMSPITIAQMEKNEDESTAIIKDLTVNTLLNTGFIATDGTYNVLVEYSGAVAEGDVVDVYGVKGFDSRDMSLVRAERIEQGSNAATRPEAVDVTEQLDKFTSETRTYVTISGVVDGNSIIVDGQTYKGVVVDAAKGYKWSDYNGHIVTVSGYFAGIASPAFNIIVADIDDKGVFEVIYFQDDFEWLDPWATADNLKEPAGQTVETNNLDAYCPQTPTPIVDDVSADKAITNKGYELLKVWHTSKKESECIYLQRNYLKFGKSGYQGGLVLPSVTGIPEAAKLVLTFDWCPMRQGDGIMDPTSLIVIVANGSDEVVFDVPEHGMPSGTRLAFINASIELTGVTVNENTKITIRPADKDWKVTGQHRWFLDNIKLKEK